MSDATSFAAGGSRQDPFDDLLAGCLERFEAEGTSALDEACEANPEVAARLREQVAKLLQMGFLRAPTPGGSPQFPERLGPFRLQAQLGGGGMGVVFLAYQEDLGREVALKLIRPDQLYFPGMRERFRREVQAIARMEHPGIVPVYSVGEQDGVPYFTMQRVRGASLAELLEQLHGRSPSRLNANDLGRALIAAMDLQDEDKDAVARRFTGSYQDLCLRIALQVAEALHHAHEFGVLHRDVKPSNIMLTPDGRAQLLDFGLAASTGADSLTRSGTPLGSMYYMSPEQGRGAVREVGPQSDVYSLGVTVYEMLTLRPPFTGESAHDVLTRIDEGNPVSPRQSNHSLSWECETVVLTAMERDAPRRYDTAASLARDIENVLEHRPINARRAGLTLRLRRLARRRPALTTLVVVGVPALVLGPILLLIQERAARQVIADKVVIADRNFGRALDAVDAMLSDVSDVDLRHVPQMEGVRRALIEKALAFYADFVTESAGDDDVKRRAARVLLRCGTLHDLLGDYARAEVSYRDALALVLELRKGNRDVEQDVISEAVSRRSIAATLRERGRVDDALEFTRGALAVLDDRRARVAESNAALSERAECLTSLGTLQLERNLDESEGAYRAALPILESLSREEPSVPLHRERLARVYKNLGVARDWRGDLAGAIPLYRQSVDYFEEFLDADPRNSDHRFEVAAGLLNLGSVEYESGDDGEETLARSIEIFHGLVTDFPGVINYRRDEVKTIFNLAHYLARRDDRDDEVRRMQREGIELARRMFADHPTVREPLADLARCLDGVCQFERGRGAYDLALRAGDEAVSLRRMEVDRYPDLPDVQRSLGAALHNVALVWKDRGEPGTAIPLLEEAIRAQRRALLILPGHATTSRFLRFHWSSLAGARLDTGDVTGALVDVEELLSTTIGDATGLRDAAGFHALAAAMITREDPSDPRAAALEARALDELGRAIGAGFNDLERIRTDEDFAALRALPGFSQVIRPLLPAAEGLIDPTDK